MINIAMRRTVMCGLPKPGDQDYVLWQRCRQFNGDDEVECEALKATIIRHESAGMLGNLGHDINAHLKHAVAVSLRTDIAVNIENEIDGIKGNLENDFLDQ